MNYLTTILSDKAIKELANELNLNDLIRLGKNIKFLDEYSDPNWDVIIADWMDFTGMFYTLSDFINSYKHLQQMLEEQQLTTFKPFFIVKDINNILSRVKNITNSID